MSAPLITLLTDFGESDAFVGILKGALLSRLPDARLVDLSHRPSGVGAGLFRTALLLRRTYRYYPAGTIHLIGQDSGAPRALAALAAGQFFLAADNGVLGLVLDKETAAVVHALPLPAPVTFLARDVLVPLAVRLAARLALPDPLAGLGFPAADWQPLALSRPHPTSNGIEGEVLHVDGFGNLITNITPADCPVAAPRLELAGVTVARWCRHYAEAPADDLFALWGAEGWLEISLRAASAAARLQVGPGTRVLMR